jgi:hypothetical protein
MLTFSYFERYCTVEFWQFLQKKALLKNMTFQGALAIFFLLCEWKETKREGTQAECSVCKKHFSSTGRIAALKAPR